MKKLTELFAPVKEIVAPLIIAGSIVTSASANTNTNAVVSTTNVPVRAPEFVGNPVVLPEGNKERLQLKATYFGSSDTNTYTLQSRTNLIAGGWVDSTSTTNWPVSKDGFKPDFDLDFYITEPLTTNAVSFYGLRSN